MNKKSNQRGVKNKCSAPVINVIKNICEGVILEKLSSGVATLQNSFLRSAFSYKALINECF